MSILPRPHIITPSKDASGPVVKHIEGRSAGIDGIVHRNLPIFHFEDATVEENDQGTVLQFKDMTHFQPQKTLKSAPVQQPMGDSPVSQGKEFLNLGGFMMVKANVVPSRKNRIPISGDIMHRIVTQQLHKSRDLHHTYMDEARASTALTGPARILLTRLREGLLTL